MKGAIEHYDDMHNYQSNNICSYYAFNIAAVVCTLINDRALLLLYSETSCL